MKLRGYFGIGIQNNKTGINVGTLWRSAQSLGASFIFTVGRRYRMQSSDISKAERHIPLYEYESLDEFKHSVPRGCQIIGVEWPHSEAHNLTTYCHPERAVYLLGGEDCGISKEGLKVCQQIIHIPCRFCLNVATAGTIVIYDRIQKFSRQ